MFGSHTERIVTGLALAFAVLFIGWLDNRFIMWIFFGVIYFLAFREANKLFSLDENSHLKYAVALWLLVYIYPYGDDLFVLAGVVYGSAVAFNKELEWKYFLPFIYPTAGVLFTFTMYEEYGVVTLLWLVITVAMTDVGAYVVGKSIGKTPFCETSPNKTMEGVVGGIVIATLSGMFIGLVFVDIWTSLIISFAASVSSIFGDLYESSLKRAAGVKDSGDLLPGHGGALDRIDGYLFGSVVMLVLLRGLV